MTRQPDPYALTHQPQFPAEDLNEVRPSGATIRRGRGWFFAAAFGLAILGIIVFDRWSKSTPVLAQGTVTTNGVGNIPLKDRPPEEQAAAETAKQQEAAKAKPKGTPAAPKRRASALGRSDAFENPSQKYAEREVASWNAQPKQNGQDSIANRRKSALGN